MTNAEATPLLWEMLRVSGLSASGVDLVARGRKDGTNRSWFRALSSDGFQSDHQNEGENLAQLLAHATPVQPLTFIMLLRGTGGWIGIDRDGDGYFNLTETAAGTDPNDSSSKLSNALPQLTLSVTNLRVHPGRSVGNLISATDLDAPLQTLTLSLGGDIPPGTSFDSGSGHFVLASAALWPTNCYSFFVRAMDNGSPPLSAISWMTLKVVDLRIRRFSHEPDPTFEYWDRVYFDAVPGNRYRLELKSNINDAWSTYLSPITASHDEAYDQLQGSSGQRYYRIRLLDE